MAENKTKKSQQGPGKDDYELSSVQDEPMRTVSSSKGKSIHHINPLGMRVVVRIPKEHNMSDGGLYLPEGAKENMSESLLCEVVEVASAIDARTHEEANVSGVPLGSFVLIPKNAGVKVPWDDRLRIVETKDVLATVEKISVT